MTVTLVKIMSISAFVAAIAALLGAEWKIASLYFSVAALWVADRA